MPAIATSETRTESLARDLMEVRGWKVARPPRGNVLWKNEYRSYPEIQEAFFGKSKKGPGDAYPDFLLTDESARVVIVGETKAREEDIGQAVKDAQHYADALAVNGIKALALGVAGSDNDDVRVSVTKWSRGGWKEIEYRGNPIQWIPTPSEAEHLLADEDLLDLRPKVPSDEVLEKRADEINRILRECKIKDEFRPAVIGAFMLALWNSKGAIRTDSEHALQDINSECVRAFQRANKNEIAESILVPVANDRLANSAARICRILRILNVTTLTAEHDYLGHLYETFFRFTGGNTIGQFFTPRHITKFIVDLCEVSDQDNVLDPTCGTGGFLISCLYRMMGSKSYTKDQISELVAAHLKGFESEPVTAALCVANMILRGDGTTGVVKGDCFTDKGYPKNWATIVVGNPPFPHKESDDPTEKFVDRALEALVPRGKMAMVVPESLLTKATKKAWREKVLKKNRLVGVISLPNELFRPYAKATTCILVFEKGVPHDSSVHTFFCKIENDGYKLRKNARVERSGEQLTAAAKAYKDHASIARFCAWASLDPKDWAPGAYIESGTYEDLDVREDVLYLLRTLTAFHATHAHQLVPFQDSLSDGTLESTPIGKLSAKTRISNFGKHPGTVGELFDIYYGQKSLHSKDYLQPGNSLVVSSSGTDNGCYGFFDFKEIIRPPCVTVPSTGSIGEAFVQTWPFGVTDDCLVLVPKAGTDLEDLYLAAAAVRKERWRFNYGRKITPERLAHMKVPRNVELKSWVREERRKADQLMRSILSSLASRQLEERFAVAVAEWKADAAHSSSIATAATHPAYLRIIGMGPQAIPMLLSELERDPDHWFYALHVLTQQNPVSEENEGRIKEMAREWIEWGRNAGYL